MLIVLIVALICTGLVAGIFLGHRAGVSPAVPVLSPSSFIQLQQVIHKTFVRMMPVLIIGTLFCSALWAALLRSHWQTDEFWLVSGASLALMCILAMTRAVNIPINKRLMTWNAAEPASDLRTVWAPWERIQSIRTRAGNSCLRSRGDRVESSIAVVGGFVALKDALSEAERRQTGEIVFRGAPFSY